MASLNKVILIGNLGADPDLRYFANGDHVCNLRLATTEIWKDKGTGEKRESTEWHRIILLRKQAEVANQYLKKGSLIYIEGRIQTRKWQGKDGQDRYSTEIVANKLTLLGGNASPPYTTVESDTADQFSVDDFGRKGTSKPPSWIDDGIPF